MSDVVSAEGPPGSLNLQALSQKELLDVWNDEVVFQKRDKLLAELKRRGLFPSMAEYMYEMTTGAYPDAAIYKDRGQHRARDPDFLQKLMARREFAESLQHDWQLPVDPCGPSIGFELTPVQRFVANFMSPKTPYESALLFHGVGVGKTCAAVQIAESWLDMYPNKKVVIVAPKIIRRGFKKNICDFENFHFGEKPDEPNKVPGCLGTKYLELSDTLYMRPKAKKTEDDYSKQVAAVKDQIERRIKAQISRRYDFYGYGAFANAIIGLLKPSQQISDPIAREEDMRDRINEMFDGTLLIIDEAHNLREANEIGQDLPDEDSESPGGKSDEDDSKDGKKLTPFLKMVLRYTVGMKLLLMTATPMYNSYKEIIFLLNLLLRNDGQVEINETDIFKPENGDYREGGIETLGLIASRYISFMRGENPQSFPLRLAPLDREPPEMYPGLDPRGMPVDDDETLFMDHLPIVTTELTGDSLRAALHFSKGLPQSKKGITTNELGRLLQAGNIVVPLPAGIEDVGNSDEDLASRIDTAALQLHFQRRTVSGSIVFQPRQPASARWLGYDQLGEHSPKFAKALEYVRNAEGVCFLYTRFVGGGALPLALALEANGYLPYDRSDGLLGGGAVTPGGLQCALCNRRQEGHKGVAEHKFTAARYILLTGDSSISPRNETMVEAEQMAANVNGSIVKVVIGSAVASEGVDLRYIREVHVLEPWYHLNKTEQIIGRGIRFRSHCALPVEKRNTTIYLHASVLPADVNRESADLYSYRIAFRKSRLIGKVTRVLKEYAIDCNLNHDAIIIQNTDPLRLIVDSQGVDRKQVSMDDMPFTAVCDWMEDCDYKCAVPVDIDPAKADDISYDEYSARWREGKLRQRMRALFAQQPYYSIEKLTSQLFADIPKSAQADLLYKIVGNRKFTVSYNNREGFIIYKNGYYLFQPLGFIDVNIPLALRIAPFPIKVETYQPRDIFAEVMERLKAKREAIAEAEERGDEEAAAAVVAEMNADDEEFEATAAPKKEAGRTLAELVQLWNAYLGWFTKLTSYDEPRRINKESWPADIGFFIQERANGQKKEEERLMNRYEVLQWFAVSCLPWTPEKKDLYIKSALQLVWDEEFGDEDRETLLFSGSGSGSSGAMPASLRPIVASQHFLTVRLANTYDVIRIINADINEVEYFCNGQTRCDSRGCSPAISGTYGSCDKAVITYIETNKDSPDPLKGTIINIGTTGSIYGFVTTEKGGYTFKSSVPPDPSKRERMKAGEKCDNVSQTNKHRTKIVELGHILEMAGHGNYSLTDPILDKSTRKIVNVKRMCMLFDFTLRYMDNMKLLGKRWFYRPLEARKAGHLGKI